MKTDTHEYYTALSRGYGTTIRQLVPQYDDMTKQVVSVLRVFAPRRILDIGAGDGTFTRRILEEVSDATVVTIEPCKDMAKAAQAELAQFGSRCHLERQDVAAFEPSERFDAIHTNLVLHNVPSREKLAVLQRLRTWLDAGGVFVWGDLITLPEPRLHDHFVAERVAFALAHGCPERTVDQNFAKEANDDHPWSIAEMFRALESSGFDTPQCVWCHDTFAIVCASRPPATRSPVGKRPRGR